MFIFNSAHASFFTCRVELKVLLLFQVLLEFLQRVIDHRDKNKMTLKNVAMVMAPNLFTFHGFGSKTIEQSEFAMAAGTANVMRFMIQYQKLLWTVSVFLRQGWRMISFKTGYLNREVMWSYNQDLEKDQTDPAGILFIGNSYGRKTKILRLILSSGGQSFNIVCTTGELRNNSLGNMCIWSMSIYCCGQLFLA